MSETESKAQTSSNVAAPAGLARIPRRLLALALAVFVIAVIAAAGGGFFAGSTARTQAERATVEAQAREQFDLALQDLRAGRYSFAQQRLQYVLSLDPQFPAADAMLKEALKGLNATPTTTPTATPIPTATLDLPRAEQLFNQAQQQFTNGDWMGMMETLLTLRMAAPDYQPYRVDGLMFIALRNQGVVLINGGKLEEGIYYLDLAERYGPLDYKTSERRDWAQLLLNLYQSANFYFQRDWKQSVDYFAQVYSMAPFYGQTSQKYPKALKGYGDQLMNEGKPCEAVEQYQTALSVKPGDGDYQKALDAANADCAALHAPKPTETPSPTP